MFTAIVKVATFSVTNMVIMSCCQHHNCTMMHSHICNRENKEVFLILLFFNNGTLIYTMKSLTVKLNHAYNMQKHTLLKMGCICTHYMLKTAPWGVVLPWQLLMLECSNLMVFIYIIALHFKTTDVTPHFYSVPD